MSVIEQRTARPGVGRPSIARSTSATTAPRRPARNDDGHWCFELEADATIPSEYVLLRPLSAASPSIAALERKIGVYLRRIQGAHGGWPLFHDGAFDMSATVKAYFALKMIGDATDAPHMRRAREAILARGGAAEGQCLHAHPACALRRRARGAPCRPCRSSSCCCRAGFPFHLTKISYWARTVLVPLARADGAEAAARNPRRRRASPNCSPRRPRACATGRAARIRNGAWARSSARSTWC